MVTQVEADSLLVESQYFMLQLSSFQTNQTGRLSVAFAHRLALESKTLEPPIDN